MSVQGCFWGEKSAAGGEKEAHFLQNVPRNIIIYM